MKRTLTALGALAAGAAALYLAHPEHGHRRRAALRRQVALAAREAVETLEAAGHQATDQLQAVFETQKAVYELRYELNNRPDWVQIPVAGVARLLEAPL
jgi:predicted trehalose synthase